MLPMYCLHLCACWTRHGKPGCESRSVRRQALAFPHARIYTEKFLRLRKEYKKAYNTMAVMRRRGKPY